MRKRIVKRVRTQYAAPAWAAEQRVGGPGIKAVLLLLARYADEAYSCFPSQSTLADESEQSRRTVLRQLKDLEEWGLIRRERRVTDKGHRTSDRFYLNIDLVVDVTSDDPEPGDPSVSNDVTQGAETLGDNLSLRDFGTPESGPNRHQESPRDQEPNCHQESLRTPALGDTEASLGDTDDTSYVTPGVTGTPSRTPTPRTLDAGANVTALPTTSPAGEGSSEAKEKPGKGKGPKKRPLPDDFELTVGMRNWAASTVPDVDVEAEFALFCDRVLAGALEYADWNRAWMMHMRNVQKWARERAGRGPLRPVAGQRSYDDTATWGEAAPAPAPQQPALPLDDEDDDLAMFDKSNRRYLQ